MRRIVRTILPWAAAVAVAVGTAGLALGQPAPPPGPRAKAVDPAAALKMDQLLTEWERQSATVTQLYAKFTRTDDLKVWDVKDVYEGTAMLKSPNLACLRTEKVDPANPKAKPAFHEQIVCTGTEVVHYDGAVKQIYIYPLAKADQGRALEEGPLPFMFNMRAADVKRRYQLHLVGEDSKVHKIRVVPLEAIDREAFSLALVHLNKQTFLPDDLWLVAPNGKDTQTFHFK